jgi:hypothetical protein
LYKLCATRHKKSFQLLASGNKMENKRRHSTQYQEDAHQIIEDFGKNHYDDTKDKGNYSSNDSQFR